MRRIVSFFKKPLALGSALVIAAAATLHGCSSDDSNFVPVVNPLPASTQVDRMAIAVVNTVFIPRTPVDRRDDFNSGDPTTDVANFRALAIARVDEIRAAVNAVPGFPAEDAPGLTSATVIGVVIPDVYTVDFSRPLNFPNGRALTDDVIDVGLGLTLNRGNVGGGGAGVSDGVGNDSTFLTAFPYLGAPN